MDGNGLFWGALSYAASIATNVPRVDDVAGARNLIKYDNSSFSATAMCEAP